LEFRSQCYSLGNAISGAKFLRCLAKAKKLDVRVAQSMLVLGCQKLCFEHNRHKANIHLKNCLEVCNSASEAEKSQKLMCLKPKKLAGMFHTVGDCLEHIRCEAESIVKSHSFAFGEQCNGCGAQEEGPPMLVCSRCRRTCHCDEVCQRQRLQSAWWPSSLH